MTVSALRSSPLFERLPDEALERMHRQGEETAVAAGAVLMDEGSAPESMYVLLDGELEVHKRVGDETVLIGAVRPGELVGELGLLHGRPRSAGVRATQPSRLLEIPAEALDELLGHAASSRTLLATAIRRLEQQELLLLQHGRMAALGSLTAGLLHELNNPAAAVKRAVARFGGALDDLLAADRSVVGGAVPDGADVLAGLAARRGAAPSDPLARADAEERWRGWLETHGVEGAWKCSGPLAASGVDLDEFAAAAEGLPADAVAAAAAWLAVRLDLDRLLDEAGTGASRIADIVSAVKAYAHHDEAPVQDVDVHDGVEAALTLLRHKIPGGVDVRRSFDSELPPVEGYPGDLNSVWTNLLDNAVDAVGESGNVEITTRAEDDHVAVAITDDGPGIPQQIADRVFDAFFTTKPVGKGTGLGLATSSAIVRQRHHGSIDVDSVPGRTTVTVRLPVRQATAVADWSAEPTSPDGAGRG